MNLADNLTAAKAHPDNVAISWTTSELTYAGLSGAKQPGGRLAARPGVERGDRVGIMLPNVPQFPIIYYGALRAGAIVVPMNPLLQGREVEYYLSDSGAKVLFGWEEGFAEEAKPGAEAAGAKFEVVDGVLERLASTPRLRRSLTATRMTPRCCCTHPETTGRPKGAELTHANLAATSKRRWRCSTAATTSSSGFAAVPLVRPDVWSEHRGGLWRDLTLIHGSIRTKALEVLQRDKVTVLQECRPCTSLVQHRTTPVRQVLAGSPACPVEHRCRWEVLKGFERCIRVALLEGYGLSETSPGVVQPPRQGAEGRLHRHSHPRCRIPPDRLWVEQRCARVRSEIAIKGPNVMKGYWRRPDATAEVIKDGWFRATWPPATGMAASPLSTGRRDMIIRGGLACTRVSRKRCCTEHPAVAAGGRGGRTDATLGEKLVPRSTPRRAPGPPPTDRRVVRDRIAAYKYPATVVHRRDCRRVRLARS